MEVIKMPDYQKAYEENKECNVAVHEKEESVRKYESCRVVDKSVLESFIDEILKDNPKTILEAGVGNGRIFLPLIERSSVNAKLYGIDVSEAMINNLKNKIKDTDKNIKLYLKDLRDKDFFDKTFKGKMDVIYTFAVLHIISRGWKAALDNMINSLSDQGKIILGEEINAVFHGSERLYENDDYRLTDVNSLFKGQIDESELDKIYNLFKEYHKLRDKFGYPFLRVNGQILHGDQSPAERYIRSKGFYEETIQGKKLSWLKPHSINEILYSIEKGIVTTLGSDLPGKVRKNILNKLRDYCKDKGYNMDKTMKIPSQIQLHVFRKIDYKVGK